MKTFFLTIAVIAVAFVAGAAGPARAQDAMWIQIEAHPDLRKARERARIYSGTLDQVHAFRMRSGWYAIALGPMPVASAEVELRRLRRGGLVPSDSFVADGRQFRRQFWPIDAAAGTTAAEQAAEVEQTVVAVAEPEETAPSDETKAQARRSERQLTGEERRGLQTALQWFGFYNAGIDGAFGPGTRRSMAAWQEAEGYEPTGILTTGQRVALMDAYHAVLNRLGLAAYHEEAAGISIKLPLNLIEFDRHDAPFAHFRAKGDDGVQALLISQTGDRATLHGLYDVMQTLEIVPLEGPREKSKNSFVLTGRSDTLVSYTYARLEGGFVKGFTLAWPPAMDETMQKVVGVMRDSFRMEGDHALDEALGAAPEDQRIDLLAGLDIRKPAQSRSGFYIDGAGTVLTTTDAVGQCTRLTIDNDHEAEVVFTDATLGIAVLRPAISLAPMGYAAFNGRTPRLRSEIAVAGYSYEGLLGAPTLTYGTLADLKGLAGETTLRRLALRAQPGDSGGPVLDAGGAVVGLLMPRNDGGQKLPDDVRFAAAAEPIATMLRDNGFGVELSDQAASMAPEDLTLLASDITVLVSCWN